MNIINMKNEFITYGIFVQKEKFHNITKDNRLYYLNKPNGGLWGSPIDSEWGWKDWCDCENFRQDTFGTYTKWRLRNPNKILVIDSYDDLVRVMNKYGDNYSQISGYYLNFSKIKEDYDGMMLTARGNAECHLPMKSYFGNYIDLNAWDCESIIVWKWNQIKIIEKGRVFDKKK